MESKMDVQEKIKTMVHQNPLILFMKGEPQNPQCGFSARVVQILEFIKVQYTAINVLNDEEMRHGIKQYGNWPTIPQLYVKGSLLGGCDIIEEKFQSGELEKELQFAQNP